LFSAYNNEISKEGKGNDSAASVLIVGVLD
jgi:hypothetical protein